MNALPPKGMSQVLVDPILLGLVFELTRDDVHLVAEARETLGQFEHEHDLAAGVRLAQFGFGADVAVRRDHQDGFRLRRGG